MQEAQHNKSLRKAPIPAVQTEKQFFSADSDKLQCTLCTAPLPKPSLFIPFTLTAAVPPFLDKCSWMHSVKITLNTSVFLYNK